MVFLEIAVQTIEDIPFSEAPERGEKGVFIAVPRQTMQDDIRAQIREVDQIADTLGPDAFTGTYADWWFRMMMHRMLRRKLL